MNSEQSAVILKRFEAPDEIRVLEKGRFELVHLGGYSIACGMPSRTQSRTQSDTQSFAIGHMMLLSPRTQARSRALQKHLAISPIPLSSVAAP